MADINYDRWRHRFGSTGPKKLVALDGEQSITNQSDSRFKSRVNDFNLNPDSDKVRLSSSPRKKCDERSLQDQYKTDNLKPIEGIYSRDTRNYYNLRQEKPDRDNSPTLSNRSTRKEDENSSTPRRGKVLLDRRDYEESQSRGRNASHKKSEGNFDSEKKVRGEYSTLHLLPYSPSKFKEHSRYSGEDNRQHSTIYSSYTKDILNLLHERDSIREASKERAKKFIQESETRDLEVRDFHIESKVCCS
jgi:hypothetical protein